MAVRESAHRARTNIKYGPSMGHGGAGDRGEVEHATEIRFTFALRHYTLKYVHVQLYTLYGFKYRLRAPL